MIDAKTMRKLAAKLSKTELLILLSILLFEEEEVVVVGRSKYTDLLCISDASLYNALKALTDFGYLTKVAPGVYKINDELENW